jgi:hypothetical protein
VFSGEKWSVWLEFARDFKEFKKSLNIRKVNCRPIEKVKDEKRNKTIFYIDNFRFELDSYKTELIEDIEYLLDIYVVLNTKRRMNELALDVYRKSLIDNEDIDLYERKGIYTLGYKGYVFFFSSDLKLKNIKPFQEIKTIGDIKPGVNVKELSGVGSSFIKKNKDKEVKIYIMPNNDVVLLCKDYFYIYNFELRRTKKMDLSYFLEHGIDILCKISSKSITFVCNGDLYCLNFKKSTINKYYNPNTTAQLGYEYDGKLFLVKDNNKKDRFYSTATVLNDKEILKSEIVLINSYNMEKTKMNKDEYVIERDDKFYFVKNRFITNKVFELMSLELVKNIIKKKNNFPVAYTESEILIYRDGTIYGLSRDLASRYFYRFEIISNEELEEANDNLMLTINI